MTDSNVAQLTQRLSEAEATIAALLSGQIDAVVDPRSNAPVLLSEAQAALRDSEERYRRIVETTSDGIGTFDAESRITFANSTFADMLGESCEGLLGMSMRQFVPATAEDEDADRERVARSRRGESGEYEVSLVRRDGARLWALLKKSPLRDAEGKFAGTLLVMTDWTRHKRDEDARNDAEAGRARAEEALRQSEGQLRQAQKMEAVGRLAGGVAHDFNNVLSVILSYGDLILEDLKAGEPMHADVEEIRKAAARGAGLTRQLLTLSRQQVNEPKVLALHDVLANMDKMLQRLLGEDVDLVLVRPPTEGRVKVDPSHIEQVILNLVVNARDAMPTGGKLTVETSNVELDDEYARSHLPAKAGPYVMLAVSDTGVGMDRATQLHIFEPFFTTKGTGKGTGLGLSTVFGIVRQSGGSVWVYSEVGRGTTFKVYLPRVEAALDVPTIPVVPATLRGSETILVVEDEEQVRTLVSSVLRRQGYRVVPAAHPGEALLLGEQHPGVIDLLLTDVVMPQMNGPELAKRLIAIRPALKVLCMSGYTDEAIVRHGVLESGAAFIQKPLTPVSLTRKVREVLDAGHAPAAVGLVKGPEGR